MTYGHEVVAMRSRLETVAHQVGPDGVEQGTWQYICVDPSGFNIREEAVYVHKKGTGIRLAHGEVVEICECKTENKMVWIKLLDGRGWAFERTNRQRMSEVCVCDVDDKWEQGNLIIRPDRPAGQKLMDSPFVSNV